MCGFHTNIRQHFAQPVEYHTGDLESVGVRDHKDEGDWPASSPSFLVKKFVSDMQLESANCCRTMTMTLHKLRRATQRQPLYLARSENDKKPGTSDLQKCRASYRQYGQRQMNSNCNVEFAATTSILSLSS